MTSCLHARLSELVLCGSWHRQGNECVIKLLMPSSVKVGSGHPAGLPNIDKRSRYNQLLNQRWVKMYEKCANKIYHHKLVQNK